MDLSLDEIIKTRRIGAAQSKKFVGDKKKLSLSRSLKATPALRRQRIRDARLKIIQNNRSKIRDARDKLVEIARASGDARDRLLQKQYIAETLAKTGLYRGGRIRNRAKHLIKKPTFVKPSRNPMVQRSRRPEVFQVPRGYVDYDNMDQFEEEEYATASRLSRTVANDIVDIDKYSSYPDSLDSSASIRRNNSWNSDNFDPFDVYDMPINSRTERNIANVPVQREVSLTPPPPKGILRTHPGRPPSPEDVGIYERRYVPDHSSHLSYEMRSRLERAPDPHTSMGIFAKETASSSYYGYRIVVSNLHTSVSESDIRELFADIGELYDSRIVRPGVAEVIYKSFADAEKAVDTYHNRQLDGLPMKCLLVNPRSASKLTGPSVKPNNPAGKSSAKSTLEIDIDALHKVLFRKH